MGINPEYISSSPQTSPPLSKPPTAAPAPAKASLQFGWGKAHSPQAPSGVMHIHGHVITLWTLSDLGRMKRGGRQHCRTLLAHNLAPSSAQGRGCWCTSAHLGMNPSSETHTGASGSQLNPAYIKHVCSKIETIQV